MIPRRFLTLDAENRLRWVCLSVHPVDEQWVAWLIAEGTAPPPLGKLPVMGFFAETRAEVGEMALHFVSACTEQN